MSPPSVEYVLPSSRAFAGMKRVLFHPFDIGKWFVLGFTAWIAGLMDGGGSGGAGGDSEGWGGGFGEVGRWMEENLLLVIGIGAVVVLIGLAILIALLWVSSRGKFMFLDNVMHNRAEVKAPWHRFRAEGDSLFLWRLGFGLIVFFVMLLIVGVLALFALALGDAAWVAIIPGVLVLVPVILALLYITILLEDFVVPVMYRESLTTNEAWKRFLALHRTSPGAFVLFALWKVLLWIAAFVCIIAFGVATLLIGFILMIIPYLGAVVLLPVSVFFRFLGPEFLRQLGSEYDLLTGDLVPDSG